MSSSAPAPTSRSGSCAREARARVSSRVVLALDQGTSGTTALVVDSDGRVIARGYAELPQYYPQPGWVEHDPEEIWATVGQAATVALAEARVRAADIANASRTLCLDLRTGDWDDEMLGIFGVPRPLLPAVRPSAGVFGETRGLGWLPDGVPIAGVAGDQQSALFGHACYVPGDAKNTYGTGCFLLLNTGHVPVASRHGLLTTIAWRLDGRITYALEGSVFIAGAAIQWLRDGLGVLRTAGESQRIAESVPDTGGVYLVPAFVGLGAPYWDMRARGTIVGLTRGTPAAHLTRAALEAIAYQSRDVLEAMTADAGIIARRLRDT